MFLLQLLIFFVSVVFVSISISGYGSLIKLGEKNFLLNIFIGFVVISFIVTFIHLFFKINLFISFFILFTGILIFLIKKNLDFSYFFNKNLIYYCFIILLFIPIFLSQKYHEDFGYYHLPYAIGLIEEKIIFGFSNIDLTYVYNSLWLNIYSIFFLEDKNFDFLTLPTFILYVSFILFSFNQIISKKNLITSDCYLVVTLFYFLLKFTRISEFGVDLPAVIFSILGIYYFFKFSETELANERKNYFFLITIFSIFSILIKLSTLPIILLSFYLYIKYFKDLKFSIFNFRYILVYSLLITFFIQQFIYTGCFFFPTNLTCLNVSWFNQDYLNLSQKLQLVNKSYNLARDIYTPEEYLKNFNWIYFWFKRNFVEILEHFSTIIFPSILFLFFLKKSGENRFFFKEKIFVYIFLLAGLIFWLNFSPVYRFAIHLFLTFIYMLLLNFFYLKHFSKKVFIIFFSIFILFNFSKNVLRLNKENDVYFGIQKIHNKYVKNIRYSNKHAKIFVPDIENNSQNGWQGRLCWDIPFICSYKNLNIYRKNNYLFLIE
tara:strand:- start:820 stop:2457 length:1638 start_codon:yes stop_codon:yes gene_type:complete